MLANITLSSLTYCSKETRWNIKLDGRQINENKANTRTKSYVNRILSKCNNL